MSNKYPFELMKLPYDAKDLEPVIDEQTILIHHGKHHQAYVDNLNKFLAEKPGMQDLSLKDLMSSEEAPIKNNAGGVWNHNFYWNEMIKAGSGHISEKLMSDLEKNFESVDKFTEKFEATALGRFGSGWAWLVRNSDNSLEVMSTANQDNPLSLGKTPMLGIDVWEHAYYLKYQNRRAEYVKAWWDIVNWDFVEKQ